MHWARSVVKSQLPLEAQGCSSSGQSGSDVCVCFFCTAWFVESQFPDQGLNLGYDSESPGS